MVPHEITLWQAAANPRSQVFSTDRHLCRCCRSSWATRRGRTGSLRQGVDQRRLRLNRNRAVFAWFLWPPESWKGSARGGVWTRCGLGTHGDDSHSRQSSPVLNGLFRHCTGSGGMGILGRDHVVTVATVGNRDGLPMKVRSTTVAIGTLVNHRNRPRSASKFW